MQYEPIMMANAPGTLVWKQGWGQATIHFTRTATKDYLRLAQTQTQESLGRGESRTAVGGLLIVIAFLVLLMWSILGLLDAVPNWTMWLAFAIPATLLVTGVALRWSGSGRSQEALDADAEHKEQMKSLVAASLVVPPGKKGPTKRALDQISGTVADDLILLIGNGSTDAAECAVTTLIDAEQARDLQEAAEADRAVQAKAEAVVVQVRAEKERGRSL